MEEIKSIEDILPIKDVVRIYFTKVFHLCEGNRSEISRRLGMNVRTVRGYCKMFNLQVGMKIEEIKPKKVEDCSLPEETGYRSVTPEQRDDWYNKDYY